MSGFTPSPYQQAIFDRLRTFGRDIRVEAVAGSGKTTTLVQALKLMPADVQQSTLMCAFNKGIALELKRRVPRGVQCRTFHSIGLQTIRDAFPDLTIELQDNKYKLLVDSLYRGMGWEPNPDDDDADLETLRCFDGEALAKEKEELLKLLHFARVTLTPPDDQGAMLTLVQERDIKLSRPDRQLAVAKYLLWAGKDLRQRVNRKGFDFKIQAGWIDFDDMVWLPHVLNLTPNQFRLTMVDECQDLNAAQLSLVLKCRAEGGRMVFVGDPFQAIYAFAGADAASWDAINHAVDAELMPLSVCYRCPTTVIREARRLVPHITARDDAPTGKFEHVTHERFHREVGPADMVLCRVNAPLIDAAYRLISEGKSAVVKGRDIGASLNKVLREVKSMRGFQMERFGEFLAEYEQRNVTRMVQKDERENKIISFRDRLDCVRAVYRRLDLMTDGEVTIKGMFEEVERLFTDCQAGAIILSSIHKAKGLEANRVWLLKPELLPHPMAETETAQKQEDNLKYVAVTRAKRELLFVTSPAN